MKNRNLDGYYFRVERDGKNESICFSDLTHIEREEVLKSWSNEQLIRLCIGLGDALEQIGNQFNLEYIEVENS